MTSKTNKIFGIGLPRSGTSSLNQALSILGYKSLHHPTYFIMDKLNGSFSFDGNWDALTNFGEHFYPQLDQLYPDSKFILTIRDKEKWLDSCRWKYQEPSNHLGNVIRISIFGCDRFHESTYSHIYDQHTRNVIEYFKDRPNDLLVVDWGLGHGWKELCDFLDKPIPNIPFPHKNSKQEIILLNKPIKYKANKNIGLKNIPNYFYSQILSQAFLGNKLAKMIVKLVKNNKFNNIKRDTLSTINSPKEG